jgi:hypothetical protein
MEKVDFPGSLIYPESEIYIYCDETLQPNTTFASIVIEGNRFGFLSLSHLINIYSSYLCDPIIINEFPFVKSLVAIEITEDPKVLFPYGKVNEEEENFFTWRISETNLFVVTGLLHSLGYANDELHLDEGLQPNEISVYCVVK